MDLITTQLSLGDYFLLRKSKINEEIKLLKDFVQQYKSIPEMKDKIMDYLQSLRRDLQDIESSVQRGQPPLSSNLNGTDLHHEQEITQQNAYFGPTPCQESEVVMSSSTQSLSCSKRKRWSKVWEDFAKYVGKDEKEWVQCKHCKKEFVGSSKSGTTHLKNHLKSCQGLRTSSKTTDKEKNKSVTGLDLDDSDLVRRIIKYGLKGIKDDILIIYEQENYKLREYLDKLPSHFSVRIEWLDSMNWYMRIYFVDDSWKLKNMIIYFSDEHDVCEIMKSVLLDWKIDRKICFVTIDDEEFVENEDLEKLQNRFNKRDPFPFIWTFGSNFISFYSIQQTFSFRRLKEISPNKILIKASNLHAYLSSPYNNHKFKCAVEKALSMGKIVTSQSVPLTCCENESLLEWVVGCKEAFIELEHIDPRFKFVSFTKEDWDDATLLYSSWQVIKDLRKEIDCFLDTGKVNFSMLSNFFLRLDQLSRSDNFYLCTIATFYYEYDIWWRNSGLALEISIILDPRCKMEMVERYCKMIYGNDAEAHLHKTIDDVTNVYNEYVKGTSSPSSSHGYSSTSESELNCYLRDNKQPQDGGFDILQWWRDKSPIYPILARMAHDFLSIPVKFPNLDSSVLDEIEDIFRCKTLDDDFKNKLACTKIWLNTPEDN